MVGKSGLITGFTAGAAGTTGAAWPEDGFATGSAWLDDGFATGAAWLEDGFAAGVGPGFVGFVAGAPLDAGAAVAGALGDAWAPPLVGRFGVTWDGPAGLPPVPTSTTFRDER